jgi:preprotein translocase subunit SecE
MAKDKTATESPPLRGLFAAGIYKRSQGRITRQVTFAALLLGALLGVWRLFAVAGTWHVGGAALANWLGGSPTTIDRAIKVGFCGILALAGGWLAFRLVNWPRFADFLISVEAEMNKVSWPTQSQLVRSVLVVLFCILFLVAVLWGYDLFWRFVLQGLGVVAV